MFKAILAGTTALALAGSTMVYAQSRTDSDLRRPDRDMRERPQTSIEDMRAYSEARLAALKAGLALTADQEKHWPAFEAAAREFAKLRIDRAAARRDAERERPQGQLPTEPPQQSAQPPQQSPAQPARAQPPAQPSAQPQAPDDPIARMRERGKRMTETGAVLTRLADATGPLYASLDDAQKRRFAMLARPFQAADSERQRDRFERRPDGPPGSGAPMRSWRDDRPDGARELAPPQRSQVEPRDLDRTPPQRFQRDNDPSRPGRSSREERDDERDHNDPEGRRTL